MKSFGARRKNFWSFAMQCFLKSMLLEKLWWSNIFNHTHNGRGMDENFVYFVIEGSNNCHLYIRNTTSIMNVRVFKDFKERLFINWDSIMFLYSLAWWLAYIWPLGVLCVVCYRYDIRRMMILAAIALSLVLSATEI